MLQAPSSWLSMKQMTCWIHCGFILFYTLLGLSEGLSCVFSIHSEINRLVSMDSGQLFFMQSEHYSLCTALHTLREVGLRGTSDTGGLKAPTSIHSQRN